MYVIIDDHIKHKYLTSLNFSKKQIDFSIDYNTNELAERLQQNFDL